MSIFGWSYPPGCSGTPFDEFPDPHPDAEQIQTILEAAHVADDVVERVMALVDKLAAAATRECPECLAQYARQLEAEQFLGLEPGTAEKEIRFRPAQ